MREESYNTRGRSSTGSTMRKLSSRWRCKRRCRGPRRQHPAWQRNRCDVQAPWPQCHPRSRRQSLRRLHLHLNRRGRHPRAWTSATTLCLPSTAPCRRPSVRLSSTPCFRQPRCRTLLRMSLLHQRVALHNDISAIIVAIGGRSNVSSVAQECAAWNAKMHTKQLVV